MIWQFFWSKLMNVGLMIESPCPNGSTIALPVHALLGDTAARFFLAIGAWSAGTWPRKLHEIWQIVVISYPLLDWQFFLLTRLHVCYKVISIKYNPYLIILFLQGENIIQLLLTFEWKWIHKPGLPTNVVSTMNKQAWLTELGKFNSWFKF